MDINHSLISLEFQIIEYQDWKDVANLEKVDPSDVTFYNASLFDWKYEVTNGALSSYSFTANTYNHTNISDRTGISVEVSVF